VGALPPMFTRLLARYQGLPLYWHVLVVNAAVLIGATLLLIFTPVTVSARIKLNEALILVAGLVVMMAANALLLRVSFEPLSRLTRVMRSVDLLEPRERLSAEGSVEIASVIRTFNEMLARLERERRQSTRRIVHALEDERTRIAQELHDEIGQRLTAVLLELAAPGVPAELAPRAAAAQEAIRETLGLVGQLAWRLRPSMLEDLGLAKALDALASSAQEQAGIPVQRSLQIPAAPLDPEVELVVYRIAQESLTNALRHAQATRVELELTVSGQLLTLQVHDDGRGFGDGHTEGAGIRGMRERALLVGGRLRVESRDGVRIRLDVPLSPERE
jgi:two-component system sensor histidine kinase UhpB